MRSDSATAELSTLTDARPILARTDDTLLVLAEDERERVHDAFTAACQKAGMRALVLKSAPYVSPPWVRFEAWVPQAVPTTTYRVWATVTVHAMPFFDIPFEYEVEFEARGKREKVTRLTKWTATDVQELVDYLLEGGSRPRLERTRVREQFYQLSRPTNRSRQVRHDWLRLLGSLLLCAWIAIAAGPLAAVFFDWLPGLELRMTLHAFGMPLVLTAAFLAACVFARSVGSWIRVAPWAAFGLALLSEGWALAAQTVPDMAVAASAEGVAGVVATALGLRVLGRRKALVRTIGRPPGEPRTLRRVDSWQTVVWDLGDEHGVVRRRLMEELRQCPLDRLRFATEMIWYWGLDGLEEREQIVVTFGRGILFAQIYPYGKDVYVGWDAHLNLGQWVEKQLERGIDRSTGVPTTINSLVAGFQQPSEYDVIDLNCLVEWTHAKIVQILKQLMAERKIEQEVDFKILRGERQRLTDAQGGGERPAGIRRRFHRAA